MEKTDQRITAKVKTLKLRSTASLIRRLVFVFLALFFIQPARAETLSLISDEESEQLLAEIAKPLFRAGGVAFNPQKIYLVNDPSLNAFVSYGNNLFIHTGTILAADGPNELAGVIAHETGHIMGGHILRQKLKEQEMSEITLVSALVAGAAAAASGRGDAAMAVMLGSQSSALTHYSRYRVGEERSADEAALKLLRANNQSPQGMLTFMKRIVSRNQINGVEETPYFRTHPVTTERVSFFEQAVRESPAAAEDKLQEQFARVKAKLFAFLMPPAETYKKYPAGDLSAAGQYARAIAKFKQLKFAEAEKDLRKLIEKEPDNPYFLELSGQIYLETGQIKPAVEAYRQALKLRPHSPLLANSLAQAMLENSPGPEERKEITALLQKALRRRPGAEGWLLLSRVYGLDGKEAEAAYAAAEFSLRIGAVETARQQALSAQIKADTKALKLKIDDLLLKLDQIKPH